MQALTVSNSNQSLLKTQAKQHLLADIKKLAPSARKERLIQRNPQRFSSAKPSDATQDTLNLDLQVVGSLMSQRGETEKQAGLPHETKTTESIAPGPQGLGSGKQAYRSQVQQSILKAKMQPNSPPEVCLKEN